MELISEFARVWVEKDDQGNGPRLLVKDMRTGQSVLLDPLELETLAWMRHDELAEFLDPSYKRWRDSTSQTVEEFLREQRGVEQ